MPAPDPREAYPSRLALVLAAVAGVLVFERTLGFAVLDTQSLGWIFNWGIDPSVNFMGWHMFRNEPWSLPPGILHSYGHPVGSSIGITDSLPVVAIPLKPFAAYLPPTFQFLGLWYLACFVLLAVFGCLLVATATASPWLQLLGGSLIVLSPTLIHRMGHASLSSHWLIVAALWLHIECRNRGMSRGRTALWLALLWVAAGVTPYIAAMIVALSIPSLIGRLRDGVISAIAVGGAFAAVTGVGWWAGGYFVLRDDDLRNSGFGVLSTNLLAPFDAPAGSLVGRVLSIDLMSVDQLVEGSIYLGLGVFWLIAIALLASRPPLSGKLEEPSSSRWDRGVRSWSVSDISLALVLLVFGLFAVSSTVTLGQRVLFEYDPGWWGPLTMLRASGRFIWPVYYALVFALIAMVVRRLPHRAAIAVLGTAVLLQAADLWGPMRTVRIAHAASMADPLPSPFWDRVLPRYPHLVLNPTNMCSPAGFDYRPFALVAGRARMTINAGYAARHDAVALAAYCRELAEDTAERRVRDDTLYVVADELVPVMESAETPVTCVRVDGFAVCAVTATMEGWDLTSHSRGIVGPDHAPFALETDDLAHVGTRELQPDAGAEVVGLLENHYAVVSQPPHDGLDIRFGGDPGAATRFQPAQGVHIKAAPSREGLLTDAGQRSSCGDQASAHPNHRAHCMNLPDVLPACLLPTRFATSRQDRCGGRAGPGPGRRGRRRAA